MKFLKVGKLKKILEEFPDDADVVIVDPDLRYHLMQVSSVGYLHQKKSRINPIEKIAIGLTANTETNILQETDYCKNLLWSYQLKEGE